MNKELVIKAEFECTYMLNHGDIDIYSYIPIMFELIKNEQYEVCAGIHNAIVNKFGIVLHIPPTEEELEKLMRQLYNDKKTQKKGNDQF